MFGLFLVSWVLAPALILGVSLGLGLLVRRLAAGRPSGILLLPVGFAATLVIGVFFTQWGATAELTPLAVVLPALAGLVLERRWLLREVRLSPRLLWPMAAAFAGFAVVAAPVVLSGEPSLTGYGRIVDIGHHLDLTAYLSSHGRDAVGVPDSSSEEVVRKLLAAGYPGGWQSVLGAFARLLGTDAIWIYQPLLAMTSAMGALALYGLLGRAIRALPTRAVSAAVAIQPNVLYAYGLVGGFKELTAAYLLVLVAALLAEVTPSLGRTRAGVPLAVALAACIAAFSLGILPWLGVLLGGLIVLTLLRSPGWPQVLAGWAAVGALTLVLSVPGVIEATKLADVAAAAEGGSPAARTAIVDLGNLAAPIPVRAAAGVWPTDDYRYPSTVTWGPTGPLMVVALSLAAVGLLGALRRRDWSLVLLGAAAGVGLAYYMARTGPWIQLKAIAITGPVVLACAFAGAVAIAGFGRRLREAGRALALGGSWLLAGAVAFGVLYGNALAYHNTTFAPAKRLRDLERIGDRYAGKGPTLYPDFEELAEYLLRDARGVGIVNPPPTRAPRQRAGPTRGSSDARYSRDIDRFRLEYIQSFSLIVRRRGPNRSRPPSNWKLVDRTHYHEVWRRTRPATTVLAHEPFEGPRPSCRRFAALARRAARGQAVRISYAEAPTTETLPLGRARRSPNWPADGRDSVITAGRGQLRGRVAVRKRGTYEFWIVGAFGRAVRISLDGEPLGTLKWQHSYPDQFSLVGRRRLGPGTHSVQMVRGGGNLEPGNRSGDQVPVGPLVLLQVRPLPLRTAPVRAAADICSRGHLDWIEIVRRS
jgi:hypothetical protein